MAKPILSVAAHVEFAWIRGDQAYLCRVTPSPDTMNNPAAWEFFAGHDTKGASIWSKDFHAIKPLLEWNGRIGHATITYNVPLKKTIKTEWCLVVDKAGLLGLQ